MFSFFAAIDELFVVLFLSLKLVFLIGLYISPKSTNSTSNIIKGSLVIFGLMFGAKTGASSINYNFFNYTTTSSFFTFLPFEAIGILHFLIFTFFALGITIVNIRASAGFYSPF